MFWFLSASRSNEYPNNLVFFFEYHLFYFSNLICLFSVLSESSYRQIKIIVYNLNLHSCILQFRSAAQIILFTGDIHLIWHFCFTLFCSAFLWSALLCSALFCSALLYCVVLCLVLFCSVCSVLFSLQCSALLCFVLCCCSALIRSDMLCSAQLCFVLFWSAVCFALLCFVLFCTVLLCSALLCSASL